MTEDVIGTVAAQMRRKADDAHDAWASTLREWADKIDPPDRTLVLVEAPWAGTSTEQLRQRGVEGWAVRDVAAAVAFLFAEEIPDQLRETLADLPQPTIETVQELVKLRGGENG